MGGGGSHGVGWELTSSSSTSSTTTTTTTTSLIRFRRVGRGNQVGGGRWELSGKCETGEVRFPRQQESGKIKDAFFPMKNLV